MTLVRVGNAVAGRSESVAGGSEFDTSGRDWTLAVRSEGRRRGRARETCQALAVGGWEGYGRGRVGAGVAAGPARPGRAAARRTVRSPPMRIAILTNEYPPNIYGGAGVHVEYLTRELCRVEGGNHSVEV